MVLCALPFVGRDADAQAVPVRTDSAARDSLAARLARDSLAARLARAEADIALLREQLATEASTQVRLRSRVRLDLQARILTNTFLTTAGANSVEIPLFAQPSAPVGGDYGSAGGKAMGLSVRQTTIGAAVAIDSVLGATFSADVEIDFFGGVSADGPPLFPPPRLRTARGFLHWAHTELMVGADTPLISDLDPVSTAAIAIPDFTTAGNLWNWLPQIRLTRDVARTTVNGNVLHWALQGAVLNPYSGDRHLQEVGGVDAGLRSARPYVQGRVRARWGDGHDATTSQYLSDRGGEIGFGGHRGWLRVSGDTLSASWAVSTDARIGLSHGLELRAEGYRGRLLRGLGGGGISQNFAPSPNPNEKGEVLTDIAGWLQLNAQVRPTIMTGAGCGTDRVENAQPLRQRNTACAAHLQWRPALPLLLGVEYRAMATRGPAGLYRARHFNLAIGIEL